METNPYQAPQAVVKDFIEKTIKPTPEPLAPPPPPTALAIKLSWYCLALSIVAELPFIRPYEEGETLAVRFGLGFFIWLLSAFLIFKLEAARNWARWVNAFFVVLALVLCIFVPGVLTRSLASALDVIGVVVGIYICWLLWRPVSSAWFKNRGKALEGS